MAVKVRISYEKPQELHTVTEMLKPILSRARQIRAKMGGIRKHILKWIFPMERLKKV